jgi:hypothetical protein
MDSPQKVLKELSDLTRNLDVLAKEVRDMSKGNASVAKAVVQSVETKKEDSKTAATSAEKTTADAQKTQEGMFSKLLGSVKKSFEEGNELFKSASLKTLSSAGKTLLETGSLKEAAKSGIEEAKDSAKKSVVDLAKQAKQKAEQLITTSTTANQTPDLKQKEKAAKEGLTAENMTSPAAKAEKTGEKSTTAAGKKGVLASLREKFFGKKEETAGKTTPDGTSPVSTPAALKEKTTPEGASQVSTPAALKEKTSPTAGSPAVDSAAVKTPAALSPKAGSTSSTDGESPKKSFKETVKDEFGKTRLGSTVNYLSSLTKKKEDPAVAESGMKNETTTLKDQSKPKSEPEKPQAEVKKEAEAKKETSAAQSPESKKEASKSSAPASAEGSASDKGKETQISSQDIQDIKGLLAAINSTLSGPLSIKNNKPFRPTSNMLD